MINLDPLGINPMLQEEIAELLKDMRTQRGRIDIKTRAMVLVYIMRCQQGFMGLRKETNEPDTTGATARKYTSAFKDAARRRAAGARSEPADDAADDDEPDDDDAA